MSHGQSEIGRLREHEAAARATGADTFLTKPVEANQLILLVLSTAA